MGSVTIRRPLARVVTWTVAGTVVEGAVGAVMVMRI
jgi:hypothetical protein